MLIVMIQTNAFSQVEKFAWEKWGSPEALDEEFERRENEKKLKKEKKFKAKLNELRRKTRTSTWQRREYEVHKHEFGESWQDGDSTMQTCLTCGISIAIEEF
ncbi:hypothetical protein HK102_000029 [Quaeritorhiza haematococci]|nr:hypothetical protein HK102_000029 [Quaeritorhiza haematococci]